MATPWDLLAQRQREDWLIGVDSQMLHQQVEQRLRELGDRQGLVLLAEREPVQFLAGFMAANMAQWSVALANPDWRDREWQQVFSQLQPDLIWADEAAKRAIAQSSPPTRSAQPWTIPDPDLGPESQILIPTGGSSGQVKFAVHTWHTLMASVMGGQQHFNACVIHSYCVLPLYHVSGLMQWMRSLASGGQLVIQPFHSLLTSPLVEPDGHGWFLSLVPTQLQRLLNGTEWAAKIWLSHFQAILLGGGAAWPQLLDQSRHFRLPVAPTYGMTETASQIATLRPADFLAGHSSCGPILPHTQVTIRDNQGRVLTANQPGLITIQSQSLALGYHPLSADAFRFSPFCPDDIGFLDPQGRLHLVGRNSTKIITGGENVFPEEVEAAIRATNLVSDVCVLGLPDPEWGQMVVAAYTPLHVSDLLETELRNAIASQLSAYKHPKRWIALPQLPRNTQGKISRDRLRDLMS